jgi:hypothetical protein
VYFFKLKKEEALVLVITGILLVPDTFLSPKLLAVRSVSFFFLVNLDAGHGS